MTLMSVCTDEKWKTTRRLLTPAFGPLMLRQHLKVFQEQAQILVDLLKVEAISGEIFDLWPYLINASIDTILDE